MHRFFVKPEQIDSGKVYIIGEDVHHIKDVLRIRIGEEISVSCQDEWEYICTVDMIGSDAVAAVITDIQKPGAELEKKITLFQCLPKQDKMETVIQKAVELGASAVVPVISERCVAKMRPEKAGSKQKRYEQIAAAAAKQSKRLVIPHVGETVNFAQCLKDAAGFDCRIMAYENAEGMAATRAALEKAKEARNIAVLIGPEGGFSEKEAKEAAEAGFDICSLGKRILRTETAGTVILSMLIYVLEDQ